MTVDCKQFDEGLLELVYHELDEETAEAMRSHAASCPKCGDQLESLLITRKLAATLEEPELPGEEMDRLLLDAAARTVRESAAVVRMPVVASTPKSIEREPGFLERFRSVLLKPAFATAAGAALVLVVTLFLAKQPSVSPNREPADPAMLAEQALSRQDLEIVEESSPASPTKEAERQEPAIAERPKEENSPPNPAPSVSSELTPARKNRAPSRFNLGTGAAESAKRASTPAAAPGGGASFGAVSDKSDLAKETSTRGASRIAPEGAPIPTFAPPAQTISRDDYERGMAAFRRGDCNGAKEALSRVVEGPDPAIASSALHHIARCEKRQGRCGLALPRYAILLSRYPGYPERPSALLEAAACRRRLGQLNAARSLLEELSRIPGWEQRAREALTNIESDPVRQ